MDFKDLSLPAFGGLVLLTVAASEWVTKPALKDTKTHVVYWEKWTDFEFKAMKDVVDAYNRSQNRIQVDLLSISGIDNKTLMAVSGNVPPDIAGLYGGNVTQYADDKAVLPLDEFCRDAGISENQYVPAFWDMLTVRGHIYALPSTPATVGLHYNKRMLRSAGIDPENPPKTWESLAKMAEKITVRDKDNRIKISGFLPAEPGWWNFMWGPLFGGSWYDGKGHLTVNSEANVRAYQYVQSFAKKYGSSNLQQFKSGFGSFSSPQNGFLSENLAMEPQGVWMYNFISKFSPKLKWGVCPLPYPENRPDMAGATVIDLDVLCIPRGAKHPKEAFEFLQFVQSQKGMEMLCLGQRKATPLRAVSSEFLSKHPNPFIKLFADMAYTKHPIAPLKLGIWPELNSEIDAAFDEIGLLKKTPREALDAVQARMQPKLDKYLTRLHQRSEL